jgi:hypothetical protein
LKIIPTVDKIQLPTGPCKFDAEHTGVTKVFAESRLTNAASAKN